MTNAKKLDPRDKVYGQVLADWQLRLRDGNWHSKEALIQSTSAELCEAYTKTSNSSAWSDLPNPHELAWARFEQDILPRLLTDDDYEDRRYNGRLEIRCCKPAPVVKSPKSIDLKTQAQHTPTPSIDSDRVPVDSDAEQQHTPTAALGADHVAAVTVNDVAATSAQVDDAPSSAPAAVNEDQPAGVEQEQSAKSLALVPEQPASPVVPTAHADVARVGSSARSTPTYR